MASRTFYPSRDAFIHFASNKSRHHFSLEGSETILPEFSPLKVYFLAPNGSYGTGG